MDASIAGKPRTLEIDGHPGIFFLTFTGTGGIFALRRFSHVPLPPEIFFHL